MLDASITKYPMVALGDTVRVRVPVVDRARSIYIYINWEKNKVFI